MFVLIVQLEAPQPKLDDLGRVHGAAHLQLQVGRQGVHQAAQIFNILGRVVASFTFGLDMQQFKPVFDKRLLVKLQFLDLRSQQPICQNRPIHHQQRRTDCMCSYVDLCSPDDLLHQMLAVRAGHHVRGVNADDVQHVQRACHLEASHLTLERHEPTRIRHGCRLVLLAAEAQDQLGRTRLGR